MAEEIILKVVVKDGDVEQTTKSLKKLGHEVEQVGKKSQKTKSDLSDTFDNASNSAGNLQGGVEGVATEFGNVAKAAKKGGAAMRSALISTGIGALIVALGFVVTHWEDILELTGLVNKDIERQNELLSIQAGVADAELSYLKSKLDLYKSQGRSIEEIDKLEQQIAERRFARQTELEQQINAANDLYKKLLSEGDVQAAAEQKIAVLALLRERNRLQKEIDDASTITLTGKGKEEPKKQGRRKREETLDGLTGEERQKALDERLQLFEELFEIEDKNNKALAESAKNAFKDITYANKVENAKRFEDDKKYAEWRKNIDQAVADAKIGVALNTLALLSQMVEKDSVAGKAFAAASTVISGIQGVQNAYTTAQKSPITTFFPAYPIIQAGLAGAFSALQLKKILSVDPTGKQTPNLGGNVGGGAAAPSFNVVGTSGVNQIAQTLGQDQNPVQAYVVGSNVTSQQALDRNIVETATIG